MEYTAALVSGKHSLLPQWLLLTAHLRAAKGFVCAHTAAPDTVAALLITYASGAFRMFDL